MENGMDWEAMESLWWNRIPALSKCSRALANDLSMLSIPRSFYEGQEHATTPQTKTHRL